MSWTREDRVRFVESLDRTKRRVTVFYRGFLLFVAVAFISYIAVAVWNTDSWGSQGEGFYLAVFVLLVLGWLGDKLLSTWPSRSSKLDLPPMRKEVEDVDGGKVFRFTIGKPPPQEDAVDGAGSNGSAGPGAGGVPDFGSDGGAEAAGGLELDVTGPRTFTFSRSFHGTMPLPSILSEHTPDEAGLATAEEYRASGRDWDYVCDWLNPDYRSWDRFRRNLYQKYIEALLDARRRQRSSGA